MSVEPVCDFCGLSDKNRCKSKTQASKCDDYKRKVALEESIKPRKVSTMALDNQTVKNLAELANRSSRSIVNVIDALAGRGAYKGEELEAIGQLRGQASQVVHLAETVLSELAKAEEAAKK